MLHGSSKWCDALQDASDMVYKRDTSCRQYLNYGCTGAAPQVQPLLQARRQEQRALNPDCRPLRQLPAVAPQRLHELCGRCCALLQAVAYGGIVCEHTITGQASRPSHLRQAREALLTP